MIIALKNKRGLTLVEVLIAMVVLLLVSLAMMQTALVSIDSNMRNVLRDEAISIAEQRMNDARNVPFAALATDTGSSPPTFPACATATPVTPCGVADPLGGQYPQPITRAVRNATINFGTKMTVCTLGTDDRQVNILVRWQYKNECFTHQISTIIRRPS